MPRTIERRRRRSRTCSCSSGCAAVSVARHVFAREAGHTVAAGRQRARRLWPCCRLLRLKGVPLVGPLVGFRPCVQNRRGVHGGHPLSLQVVAVGLGRSCVGGARTPCISARSSSFSSSGSGCQNTATHTTPDTSISDIAAPFWAPQGLSSHHMKGLHRNRPPDNC